MAQRFFLLAAACGLAAIAAAGMAVAQGPAIARRPMTFTDLMAMKRVSDPQISPSGKWVLFSVTDADLAKNTKINHLWVVPMDGSAPERQLTTGPGESFGRFAPNGKQVSFTQMPGKDEGYARIVVARWDEKAGTVGADWDKSTGKVLGGWPLADISGDADGAVWSPDSKKLMLTTEVWPECSVKGGGDTEATTGILRYAQDDGSLEVSGTRDGAASKTMQPASWFEEDACDKVKDEAAEKNPVKAQVWDGLLYRHWDQFTGAKRTHILVAELRDAQVMVSEGIDAMEWHIRDVTTARDVGDAETPTWMLGGPQEYAWAPDSKEIAYVTNLDPVPAASTNNDVFTLRLDDPNAKPVKISTSPGSDDEPEYSPDGKYLAFRSQKQAGFESDLFKLLLMDRTTRALETVDMHFLNPPTERFSGWVDEFVWSPDGAAIVFSSAIEGEEPVFVIDIHSGTMGEHPTFIRATLHGEYGDLRLINVEHSEMHSEGLRKLLPTTTLVSTRMSVDQPAVIVATQLGTIGHTMYTGPPPDGKMLSVFRDNDTDLTHLNGSSISQLDVAKLVPFWFTGAEGTEVEGFLIKPPNFDPQKKYPLKFLMHGGPQTAWGDAWSYRWNWELMAANGYVVIGINRRGSTGYGQKFVDEVSGDWGGRAYEDLMKGLDYAEAKYPFIDRTRECALGASYGGFMADWVLTHTNRFQCIVTHDGLYDAAAAYGSTEELWFPEWEFRRPEDFPKGWDGFAPNAKQTAAGHAAEPWRYSSLPATEDPFRKWSPKEYIQNAKTPTLIIHSQHDYRLDVSQGFELYTALQRLGVPSRFLYFPDESHWVLKPRDSELWNAVVSDWCDRWTHTGKYANATAPEPPR